MPRVLASDAHQHIGESVELAGWLHQVRKFGGVTFLLMRDRSGLIQAVFDDQAGLAPLSGLQTETVIELTGTVVAESRARLGVEIHQPSVRVICPVRDILPFEINKRVLRPHLDTLLDHAAVGLRHQSKQAMLRLGSSLLAAFAAEFTARGFSQIRTPKLVGAATEGGANLFAVNYFERYAFLAQSPQLYKQIMVGVLERVFEIGPAFRAEPHYTTRHINEFTSIDAEIGFVSGMGELMDLLIDVLREVFRRVATASELDLAVLGASLPEIGAVPRVTLREAQAIILRWFGENCSDEPDLAPQHERWLCDYARQELGTDFLFVTHYPVSKRPFYTAEDSANLGRSLSFDLLYKGQELVTGGMRVSDWRQLVDNMLSRRIDPAGFAGYLEAFRYGMPPEGGFAIGYERLLGRILGAENIRETTLFPRDVNRLTP